MHESNERVRAHERCAQALGSWIEESVDLLAGIDALRRLGGQAHEALAAVLDVRAVRRVSLSWQLFEVMAAESGVDARLLLCAAVSPELVEMAEAALFDRQDLGILSAGNGDDCRLGERLRDRRLRLGLTQTEAASLLGVNQSTVAKWERGDRMDIERLPALARFLGRPARDLAALYLDEWGEHS